MCIWSSCSTFHCLCLHHKWVISLIVLCFLTVIIPMVGLAAQCSVHREEWAQTSSQSSQSHVAQSADTMILAVIYHSLSCFFMALLLKHVNSQVPRVTFTYSSYNCKIWGTTVVSLKTHVFWNVIFCLIWDSSWHSEDCSAIYFMVKQFNSCCGTIMSATWDLSGHLIPTSTIHT
jgi:hypothetical protein